MSIRKIDDGAVVAAKRHSSAIVVGAGVAGLACALGLARAGRHVTLLGEMPRAQKSETRVFALNQTARLFLEALGAWANIEASGVYSYRALSVYSGTGQLDFTAADARATTLGHIVSDYAVRAALFKELESMSNVTLHANMLTCLRRLSDGWIVTQDSGDALHAGLLIVADGANSRTRALLGIETDYVHYNQNAVTATLRIPAGENGWCRQQFCEEGIVALLPVDKETVSVVWSCPTSRAEELRTMSAELFIEKVARIFTAPAQKMALLSERISFPIRGVRAKQFVLPGAVLIGDAAHAVHPMAGLGANLGLADARTLTRMAAACPAHSRVPWSVLCRYRRATWRRHFELQTLLDAVDALFAPKQEGVIRMTRETGLNVVNQCPRLKAYFARRAADLTEGIQGA